MLLDEPFAALDARLRESVRAEVRDILRRAGTTVVLVTHDRDEALSLADTVAVLRRGRIAQSAPPDVLYTSPVDAAVARFVCEANLVPGRFDGRAVWTALGTALATDTGSRRPPSGPVTVLVRPEALSLALPGAPGLAGRVVDATYHGAETMIRVRPDADAWAGEALLVESRGAATVRVGDPVVVTIGVERVHLLPP
jgi:iron(III) transport system ATP-binding protein